MNIPTLWYFACFVFAFYSLEILVEESYEVVYRRGAETEPFSYLACERLKDLYPNRTEIDLKKLRDDLYERFNTSEGMGSWRKDYPSKFEELVLNQTKFGSYLILNGRVCLTASTEWQLRYIGGFLAKKKVYFAIKQHTFDLTKMVRCDNKVDQLTVIKKEPPYSNCRKNNNRFHCLNECFKRSFRLSRYLYYGNETGTVQLIYSHRSQTIRQSQRVCFNKCKRENCKMIQLISIEGLYEESKRKNETLKAQPKLSASDYWAQLSNLLCLFAGLSFHELISITILFAVSKVRKRKVKIVFFGLKLAIFIFCLSYCCYLCTCKMLDFRAEQKHPTKITRSLIKPDTVHLTFCVYIGRLVGYSKYKKKTMAEIERETDFALNGELKGIYTNYHEELFETNYQIAPKVLFKGHLRCFLLVIHPNYQKMPSDPKLTIKLKRKTYPEFYLHSENEHLNEKTFRLSSGYSSIRKVVKRTEPGEQCVNHEENSENCTSRSHCVDRCINRKLMEKFNETAFFWLSLVIDKDWFSPAEWNTSHPIKSPHDNRSVYDEIRSECLQAVPDEKPCVEIAFEETVLTNQPDRRTKEIDLHFELVQSEESASPYKLLLDLVSIQSIFFGLTVFSSLQMLCSFFQRNYKTALFLVYLLCSFGGAWQTYHIFDLFVSRELVASEHYELTREVRMPEMTFCFKIDQNQIDNNHRLTGNYLEELTKKLKPEKMFKSITYLNELGEWRPFNLSLVKRFYFLNMKCFRIKIDKVYDRNEFYFATENQVLKVDFARKKRFVHFMTKTEEAQEASKMVNLEYTNHLSRFSITQETSIFRFEDRFSFARKHFHSFKDSDTEPNAELLELLTNEYKTLKLPLEENDFELELQEHLFQQLHWTRKIQKKQTNINHQQVANHLRENGKFESEFSFNLNFLQKIVFSTNEETLCMLIFSLLNVLSIWLDLSVLDLYPILIYFHNYFLVYLYLHVPIFIRNCLRKIESPLYDIVKSF